MSAHMTELALRKRLLLQRSAVLRLQLAIQVGEHVAPVLRMGDRVVASGQWLRRHPAWLVGAAVALLVWRPKGLVSWAGRGVWAWQAWLKLQPMVARFAQLSAVPSAVNPSPTPSQISTQDN